MMLGTKCLQFLDNALSNIRFRKIMTIVAVENNIRMFEK